QSEASCLTLSRSRPVSTTRRCATHRDFRDVPSARLRARSSPSILAQAIVDTQSSATVGGAHSITFCDCIAPRDTHRSAEPQRGEGMAKVFISYRRADSAAITGRIYDRLVSTLGKDAIFKDVDNVAPGVNFATYVEESLRECAVLLLIIGPHWLDAGA